MFHNDGEKSLRSQAIEESILNHLFLPINLPTSADKDYLIQNQHENEYKLLEYIIKFFKSFDEKCILPIFPKLINCIKRWSVIQNPKNCTPSNLQLSIQQLQSGEFLPLYFHAQNAAILIEIDHDTTEQLLISSWQVLLPTDTITSSVESHLSCFPVTTYRLCDRTLLTSSIQCELLVEFMMNTIEYSKSRKGVSRFDEVRDVPIAHYVCQWWIAQLQGERVKNNSDLTYQFQKKHRDHIRWKDAQQPFRRSGLWMTIKVILQLILTKDLGINGRIIYKSLIALFLTDFISTQNLSTDLSVYCTRKITRRVNKIEFLISKTVFNEMHEWIETILSGIRIKLDQILSKFVHPQAMEISYNKNNNNESWLKLQQELNHIHTYQHLCTDLKEHLKSHQLNQSNRLSYTNPKTDLLLTDVNTIDYIPSIEVLESQYDYSTDTILTRLEIWIESNLEQWMNRPASRNNEKNRFEVLLNFFEAYQNIALKHYGSEKNSTDPIGYSRFLLNSMTLIQIMHEKLCFDQRFERLKLHTLKIPNVLKLFEYLTLPNRDDMVRARRLYNFFDSFKEKIYPDIFDINQSNAFGVVFAESSESMNESLRQIHEQIKKDKQDKLEEVALAKKEYQKCMEEAGRLSCTCDTYRYCRVCERCSLVNKANNIRVQIYECPLPTRREDALAVIFELQMPSEFRCYRDVVWQFINHPKPRPSHDSYYEWLKVSPHSKKLSPFYTGPPDCQVKLVSSVKSLTQSHYSTPPLITSMSADSFLCENALKVQISPNKSISFEDECCMLTPRLVHPNYRHLQFAINSTRFVQNEVIARLSECPSKMKSVQHIEFGSFRSGHHLQWWNLLSSLELDSLAFDEESVVMLIAHSLWQYGPVTSTDNLSAHAWCTESHQQVLKDHFVDELIERLKHRLDDCKYNWQNEFVLFIVIIIIMRILTLCNSTREVEMTKLVMRCREIGNRWIELLTKSIQTLSTTEIDQIAVLRVKITNIALACVLTFSTDSNHVHCILSTNEHVMFILKTVTTMHDNISLNKNQTHKNDFMRDIMRVGGRIIVAIQPTVNKLIDKTSYQSLNEFSRMYWAVLQNDNATHIQWNKRNTNIYDGWYDGRYQEVIVSIDCLNGVFLVNGMTIGYLPHKITSHPIFIRVFDNHVFEVQATGIYNSYITKQAYHGNERVHYKFHFNESSQHLIIHQQHICSNEEYQLIPHNTFAKELPNNLASDHSHWRNTKTHDIFFRPVRFANNDFLNNISYKLFMRTGSIITQDTDQPYILINQSSTFFYTLFSRYFSRLDDQPYVYMMRENALQIIASSNITSKDAIVHIYLSRLGLRFTYNGQLNAIISREYSDMCITEDQSFGTLSGLQSGLLLSAYSASTNQENKYDKCQKLIVPFGNMRPHRKVPGSYHTVTIERQASELGLRQYFIFTLNDRLRILQSTDSPMGWLYLALLHAFTSQPIPDLYTGMTGMERAFQLLNSAGCYSDQPYDELSLNILRQIASLTPKVNYYPIHLTCMERIDWNFQSLPYSIQHFGYYFIAKKLLISSQNLSFMYLSSKNNSVSKIINSNGYNERLLAKLYWNYRDSHNPTARLSEQIEAELLNDKLTEQYQTIGYNYLNKTNYDLITLSDSLYADGYMTLKDSNELNCFPLNRWLTSDFELKNIWIGLFKLANQFKSNIYTSNRIEIERFELLLDFLHYISAECSIRPYYLQMLRTTLNVSSIFSRNLSYPEFINYGNIKEWSFCSDRIYLPRNLDSSERATALAEIERCFDSDTTYKNYRLPYEDIDINALLRLWRRNKQLRSFLFDIQRQFFGVEICQLKMLMPTSTQQFKVELYEDHYHIQLDTANTITDRNTFDQAKQKFLNSHSGNFIIPLQSTEISNPQRLFPVEVFSSIDHQINPLSDITKHFQNQLMESWNTFILTKEYRTKYPTLEEMRLFLKSIERESELFWNELERSIICSHELLFRTGLMERILPATLISIFQKIWLNEQLDESKCSSMNARMNDRKCYSLILTTEQCILLGGTIVNWIIEQQTERALYLAHRGKREDFEKEISNIPHKNWIPSKHILWLILELEMNITIRETQIEVARHMMDPQVSNNSSTKNIVMQMNMGEGKTSVILPMLALNLSSSSSSLVRIIVLKSLFSMNHQSLRYKLGGLLNRRILPFACRRDMNFSSTQMSQIFNRFKQGLNNCDVILTSPEDILSYDLLTIDKCRRKEFGIGRLMLSMQCWSKHFVRDILDESDEILHVKYQLIYTVGGQQQIDGGIERWKTIQIVLESVRKHASDIAKNFPEEVSFEFIEHMNHFPKFHLLGNKPYPTLCEKIAEDWFSRKNYRQNERDLISNLILNSNTSIDSLINQFSHHDIQLFLTLRGLLSSEVLLVALKKRFRVNYGVNPNSSFNRLMAVPFRAKDVAAEKTEFGHIDVAIVLTQLSYYYSGLTDSQMMDCFNRLIEEERDPRLIYDEWIFQENQEQIHISIKEWKNVNLKDYYQRTCYLFPTLRYNTLVINYFLNHFVYPREAKQFPYKLISSAWDLSTADRTHRVTGFSGTNDTQLLLPVSIRQYDLPKLRKTDAIVVNNLLKPENNRYRSLPMDANTMSILTEIVNYTSLIQVILDVGALFIDQTNREVAIKWLEMSDKTKIDYAIYLESDSIIVCNRQFHHHSFLTSPASERLDRCIIYLDEIHTRGTDFKFPSGFHAAVTLGTGLTKDRFVQACMRMRRLGDGHSLSFWSSNEVHQQIRISKKRNSYAIDILRWVYQNTIHSIWDGFHHWAAQSLSYQRKVLAFQNIHWKNHQETFTNTIMEQLVQQCLEPEVIELKQMYGSPKQMQTVLDIYLFRQQQSASLPDIHQKVKDQLKIYSGSKKRLAQLLDEEQEKELEQELEEERQYEPPPPVKPCIPILHEELQRLCDTNASKVNLKHLPSVFQPLLQAFVGTGFFQDCQSNGWHENLWITTEFQRVIERNGEWLDPFLRPPRWIIIYRNETMICVSAFEANWLIYHLQSNTSLATTLRLFLPRLKRHQSIFINTPTLSIPPALRLPRDNSIFNVPDNQLAELFLFNGTLYFQTMHEQNAYCAFLGLCPKPRTPFETDAFEQGWIGADGFVINSEHRSSLSILQCRFTSNPMKFVKHLVENRNNSHAPITSHVGSIIFNSTKLFSTE